MRLHLLVFLPCIVVCFPAFEIVAVLLAHSLGKYMLVVALPLLLTDLERIFVCYMLLHIYVLRTLLLRKYRTYETYFT